MIDIKKDFSLKKSNSLAFDHRVEYYCDAETLEDCQEFIEFCLKKNIPINLLGEGTNIVLTKNIEGGVLKVSIPGRTKEENIVNFGAGENWNEIVLWSLENQLFGLENLALIPGTVGAAPVQNIGAYGEEISSRLISVEAINLQNNEPTYLNNKECKFGYRDSIFKREEEYLITSVKLELNEEPKTNTSYESLNHYLTKDDIDPEHATPFQVCRAVTSIRNKLLPNYIEEPNVGSFFKNLTIHKQNLNELNKRVSGLPYYKNADGLTYKVPVAFLIEKAGWKGHQQGNVRVSKKHALVLIADKGATSDELLSLSSSIVEDIYMKTLVKLEIEPEVI